MIGVIDADVFAYKNANNHWSIEMCVNRALESVFYLHREMGSDLSFVVTGTKSKGDRELVYPEYQANRLGGPPDPERRERVSEISKALKLVHGRYEELVGVTAFDQEADDLCRQLMLREQKTHGELNVTLYSEDKDLRMVKGKHHLKDGTAMLVSDLGVITQRVAEKSKKTYATGALQWALQMLIGDKVDNIPGIGLVGQPYVANILGMKVQTTSCGEVRAFQLLSKPNLKTEEEVIKHVINLYRSSGADWQFRFKRNAVLLWIRRNPNILDVFDWIDEKTGIKINASDIQDKVARGKSEGYSEKYLKQPTVMNE